MNRLQRDVRATLELTRVLLVRMLREGIIVRSLAWPPALVASTLLGTATVVAVTRQPEEVIVTPALADLVPELSALGFRVRIETEPSRFAGSVLAATDGETLWANGNTEAVERIIRIRRDAGWYPDPPPRPPLPSRTGVEGLLPRLSAILYTLYGAVFGLAATARDRNDGTLAAELALPVHRSALGLARWLAPTVALSAAITSNYAFYAAIIGAEVTPAMLRNGIAAAAASVALGLGVVGTSGLDNRLSGPLAIAILSLTALFALGGLAPGLAAWIPVASLLTNSPGWAPVAGAMVAGLLAVALFARRTAVM